MFALSNDVYKDLLHSTLGLTKHNNVDSIEIYSLFTYDNFVNNMIKFINNCNILNGSTYSTYYMQLFDVLWTYNNSLHFIVKNLPCMDLNFKFFMDLKDDLCVDFKYRDKDYFIIIRKYSSEHIRFVEPKEVQSPYVSIDVYAKRDNCSALVSAIPLYQLYVFPELHDFRVRVWFDLKRDLQSCHINFDNDCIDTIRSFSNYLVYEDIQSRLASSGYPGKGTVISIVQYVLSQLYCKIEYKDVREGKGVKYSKPSVKYFDTVPNGDINVLTICKFKAAIKKREYKGGHHASPITHRRRGYYRKSSHGDYIWDEYTETYKKVYGGVGTHIFVKSCIVNPGNTPLRNNYYIV